MASMVNADVVIAALEQIEATLMQGGAQPIVRVSSAKMRTRELLQSVKNQAAPAPSRLLPPDGWVGLALSRVDAAILLTAVDAFNTEYASDDEQDRLGSIATALRAEIRGADHD